MCLLYLLTILTKIMSESENKSSKPNCVDPMQRLASLKAPRDLMLGGVKPNKKVYVPNLNVTRNKNKVASTASPRDQKKADKAPRDRRVEKNRNFKDGPRIIKSTGIFSEGVAAATRQSSRVSYGRDSSPAQTLQKPTIRVKDVIKIDKELEEQKIKSVLGESDNVDEEESMDFKKAVESDAPIELPMHYGVWPKNQPVAKVKHEVNVKQETVVKQEGVVKQEVTVKKEPGEHPPLYGLDVYENTSVADLLQSDKQTLILLQLPETLPGRGGSVEDEAPRRKPSKNSEEPSTSTDEGKTEEPVENDCVLSSLEEGRIGKLQIHRSGKVTLVLGDSKFVVSMGTNTAFHQEVVSVGCDDATKSANMVSLGPLQHTLNVQPDWEDMFRSMNV